MEKERSLSDSLSVSDSGMAGIVVVRGEDGRIIFRKKNMIVNSGRQYIFGLVKGAIDGTLSSPAKISEIRFGTGTLLPIQGNESLGTPAEEYDTDTSSLVWRSTAAVSSGSKTTTTAGEGAYLYDTGDSKLYLGSSEPAWVEASNYTTGSSIPTSGTENHLFYNTLNGNLYVRQKALAIEEMPSSDGIGLKISATIRGNASSPAMISELGLFLDDGSMFSRLAFEPVPLTGDMDAYTISYYVYF
jgi:hypothetical protein